ncbi:hypothetical protein CEV33_2658 [Brucella grignonensis]|uniref:Uncharacterized protein n=1 Tax=Brucella grignonensis TaxID=94627 RepID=A0A256F2L3_9HYPH|nr:hypothetical protein CEV33_2658 [Brucella grignonensis]
MAFPCRKETPWAKLCQQARSVVLLDFIECIKALHGYDAIYGNNQNKLPK